MMDNDLITAALGVMGLAIFAGVAGVVLASRVSFSIRVTLLAASLISASLYASLVVGRLSLADYLPGESVILLSNATPILILFATGLAWTLPNFRPRPRRVRLGIISGLSVLFFFSPCLRHQIRPVFSDDEARFDGPVCVQSHWATCAPAAATTLLNHHDISVTEQDMIRRCLTSCDGTEPLGLYRGLVVSTKGHDYVPSIADRDMTQWGARDQFPLIALIAYRGDEATNTNTNAFRRVLGRHGDGHAIVVFGRKPNGDYIIGDPAVGRTVWKPDELKRRFIGNAIYLARAPDA